MGRGDNMMRRESEYKLIRCVSCSDHGIKKQELGVSGVRMHLMVWGQTYGTYHVGEEHETCR